MTTRYLACDLGAESGRLMLGTLADGRLTIEELHRFPNQPFQQDGSLQWNIEGLFAELRSGLRKAGALGQPISSISTDSWGVDYVLLDAAGRVMPPAFHYRDSRTERGVQQARARLPWAEIFEETGIQFMPLNTLFQLAAEDPKRLRSATRLLTIGDAFNYWLSGVACAEESNASTTQLYNPRTRAWSKKLIQALELPEALFPSIVPPGTRLGPLQAPLASESGLASIEVVAGCTHDTGAAVAGVPASGEGDWAYISSGTWSLMGVELTSPIITAATRELNFTNEMGYGGTVRLLKNISGMWLVQECRRSWAGRGEIYDYSTLARLAEEAPAFGPLIRPTDPRFLAPPDMPSAIESFCRETGQPAPSTPGEFIRCVLESLALLYRQTLRELEQVTGRRIDRVHIVGGGGRNALLNQLAADAMAVPVMTGPVEATAIGNLLIQAIALGHIESLVEAREIIRRSFDVGRVEPSREANWESHHQRYAALTTAV